MNTHIIRRLSLAGLLLAALPLQAANWQILSLPDLSYSDPYWSPQFAMRSDGRFVLAHWSKVFVQRQFGAAATDDTTAPGTAPFDPSFIALKDNSLGLIGAGGSTAVYSFQQTGADPVTATGFAQIAAVQSYAGVWWRNPATGSQGWLIGGQAGTGGTHAVKFFSESGVFSKLIVDSIAAYSSGMAVDAAGNLYVAKNAFPNPKEDVFCFTAAQVESALSLAGSPLVLADGRKIFSFDSAGSLAVDGRGRLWAGGFAANGYLEVLDLNNGAHRQEFPSPLSIPGAGGVLLQPQAFHFGGEDRVAFTAFDSWANVSSFFFGTILASGIAVPNTVADWKAFHFGSDAGNAAISGPSADPDRDGTANLIEYACGSSPVAADAFSTGSAGTSGGSLVFSFLRDPASVDVSIIVEVSSSLSSLDWNEIARSTLGAATVPSGIGAGSVSETAEGRLIRVTVTDAAAGLQGRFARLRVIQ